MRLLAEELLNALLNLGHTGHTTNENNFVDLGSVEAGIFQCSFTSLMVRLTRSSTRASNLARVSFRVQMLWTGLVCSDIWQVDSV